MTSVRPLVHGILFLAVFASPVYLFPSGSPQPAHMFMVVLSAFSILTPTQLGSKQRLALLATFIYVTWVFFVNTLWGILTSELEFVYATIYQAYDFCILFMLVGVFRHHSESFNVVRWAVLAGLALQVVLFPFGVPGTDVFYKGFRYCGTLNDPNQLAYWAICGFSIIAVISLFDSSRSGARTALIGFVLAALVVLLTQSRSGFLALVVSGGVTILISTVKGNLAATFAIVLACVCAFSALIIYVPSDAVTLGVIDRLAKTDIAEQADIRGYTRIIEYPEYIVLGAGEGFNSRFGTKNEIHSTWANLLFSYGVIGLVVFLWAASRVVAAGGWTAGLFLLGPFAYGVSTHGLRTPIVWVLMAVIMCAKWRNRERVL